MLDIQPVAALVVISLFFSFSWIVLTRVPAQPSTSRYPMFTPSSSIRVPLPVLAIRTSTSCSRLHPHQSLPSIRVPPPAFVLGEFNFMQLFWGVPTMPDVFSGLLKLFTILCTCACASDTSIWLSSLSGSSAHDFMPQAGESGVTDAFAGILKPFTSPCAFPHTFGVFTWLLSLSSRSRHISVLLEGKSSAVSGLLCMY